MYRQPLADGSVTEDVIRLVQDQEGSWRWFFGRSQEFVDQQSRAIPSRRRLPRAGDPRRPRHDWVRRPRHSSTCSIPTWHMYARRAQSRVSGIPRLCDRALSGPGEAACLEELERLYPWFDREHEDAENAAAASRLGLTGDASDWVWENWLAIEDAPGYRSRATWMPTDACITASRFLPLPVAEDDLRMRLGTIGSTELLSRTAATSGVPYEDAGANASLGLSPAGNGMVGFRCAPQQRRSVAVWRSSSWRPGWLLQTAVIRIRLGCSN